ncbi:hypothetical protein AC578_5695 [Pseudocercospora eumusae]|uniref:Uncharacterized protein n=1 Tax=Pseudocercospora eumusae TaxID=321146 RepID=A0A139HEU8_9PEZI|nr:hypothetical protein AC578_5695 [Pseudocercospora eumusae]
MARTSRRRIWERCWIIHNLLGPADFDVEQSTGDGGYQTAATVPGATDLAAFRITALNGNRQTMRAMGINEATDTIITAPVTNSIAESKTRPFLDSLLFMFRIPTTIATTPNSMPKAFAFQELAAEAPPPPLLLPPLPPAVPSALVTDSKALLALARMVARSELKLALQLASEAIELVISAKELSASAELVTYADMVVVVVTVVEAVGVYEG